MRQVCPSCNRDVGGDHICSVCGPVKPIVIQEQPQPAAGGRAAAPGARPGPSGKKPATSADVASGSLVLVGIIGLAAIGYVLFTQSNTSLAGTEAKKAKVVSVLVPLKEAIEAKNWGAARGRLDELEGIVGATSNTLNNLRTVVRVLSAKDGTIDDPDLAERDLTQANEACRYLSNLTNFDEPLIIARIAQTQLEKRVLDRIEAARDLAAQGQHEDAWKAYESIPKVYPKLIEQVKKDKTASGNKWALRLETEARKALAAKEYSDAYTKVTQALRVAWGGVRKPLVKLEEEIRGSMVGAARRLYAAGDAESALDLLESQRNVEAIKAIYDRIKDVADTVERAERAEREGANARPLWQHVITTERDAKNAYRKRAMQAITGGGE